MTNIECQSNGQGWHNRLLTKPTPSSLLFYIQEEKKIWARSPANILETATVRSCVPTNTARKMRFSAVLLSGNVLHISDQHPWFSTERSWVRVPGTLNFVLLPCSQKKKENQRLEKAYITSQCTSKETLLSFRKKRDVLLQLVRIQTQTMTIYGAMLLCK